MNSIFFATLALILYTFFQFGAKHLSHLPPYLITAFLGTFTAIYGWSVSIYYWESSSEAMSKLGASGSTKILLLLCLVGCLADAAFIASYYYKGNPVTVVSIVSAIPITVGVLHALQSGKNLNAMVWIGILLVVSGVLLVARFQA